MKRLQSTNLFLARFGQRHNGGGRTGHGRGVGNLVLQGAATNREGIGDRLLTFGGVDNEINRAVG